MFGQFFSIKKSGSSMHKELIAELTTFMTMAYILAVNPDILSTTDMDKGALLIGIIVTIVAGIPAFLTIL